MGKPSRRPNREKRKHTIDGVKKTRAHLRKERQARGLQPPPKTTTPNSQSPYKTFEEEKKSSRRVGRSPNERVSSSDSEITQTAFTNRRCETG